MKGFTTKAIHGTGKNREAHGSLRAPTYDGVAFEFETAAEMQQAFEGRRPSHSYSRVSNPTVAELENRIRAITDAAGVLAVSSGMAAIANVVFALAEAGSHLVASNYLFGNTYSLLEHTFKAWGLSVSYVDMTQPAQIAAAISENTRLVFLEVITNPQLQVADVRTVVETAAKRGVPVVVDGTMTSLALFRSKDSGAAVEVLSSTKAISGGGTSLGGLIIDNGVFDWRQNPKLGPWFKQCGPGALLAYLRREVYRNLGACLAPHNASLQLLGLETLELRMQKSCANALHVARWLRRSPNVVKVQYPGLDDSPYHAAASSQVSGGFGSLLTFQLPSREACFRFMDRCKVVRRATNVHDNKTLLLHPASTIFVEYTREEKAEMGVCEEMLRLSVGIEDVEDIVGDLTAALEAV